MRTNVVEIEVGPDGDNLFFFPLDRAVRGFFSFEQWGKHEPSALQYAPAWPGGIPAQRIGIDLDAGEAYLAEPLREPEFAKTLAKIEKRGLTVEPARQVTKLAGGDDAATWLYWMKRAVDDGNAKLVAGEFPMKLPGTPKRVYGITTPQDDSDATIRKLLAVILATLTPQQQARVDELMTTGV